MLKNNTLNFNMCIFKFIFRSVISIEVPSLGRSARSKKMKTQYLGRTSVHPGQKGEMKRRSIGKVTKVISGFVA